MIGIRLTEDYQRRLRDLAREAKMKPGPFARRVLIGYLESQAEGQSIVLTKLSGIEQSNRSIAKTLAKSMLRLERKVTQFLDNAEIVDPT